MGYIYRIGHNEVTKTGSYLAGNLPLSNGSVTGSISSETTRYLHCANKVPSNNLVIGNHTLNCGGKEMTGNISIETVTAPYTNSLNTVGWSTGSCVIYWSVGASDGVVVKRNGTTIYTGAGSSYQISSGTYVTGYLDSGLSVGSTYSYTITPYRTYFGSTWYGYESSAVSYYASNYASSIEFTGTGSWTVPTGVRTINVFVVGGGGNSGSWGSYNGNFRASGGGGGASCIQSSASVIPGQTFTATIAGATGTSSFAGISAGGGGSSGNVSAFDGDRSGGAGGAGGGVGGTGGINSQGTYDYGTKGGAGTTFNGINFAAGGSGGFNATQSNRVNDSAGNGEYYPQSGGYATNGTANRGGGAGGVGHETYAGSGSGLYGGSGYVYAWWS